jgi:hypothetical protein
MLPVRLSEDPLLIQIDPEDPLVDCPEAIFEAPDVTYDCLSAELKLRPFPSPLIIATFPPLADMIMSPSMPPGDALPPVANTMPPPE